MDWVRRNWPDLLIGAALLLVIGAIVATLLTGGSFFPFGQGRQSQPIVSTPTRSAPAGSEAPSAVAPPVSRPAAAATAPGVASSSATAAGSAAATSNSTPNSTSNSTSNSVATADPDGPAIAVLPPLGGDNSAVASAATGSTSASSSAPAATATRPSVGSSVSEPQQASAAGGLYRVSVGAFSNAENAQRQAATFRAAGYPVFIGTQGNLSLVLVGPYETEAEAQRVANEIRNGSLGVDAVVYRFRPDGDSVPTATGSSATTVATTVSPSASPAPAPQQVSGRYLQVGAYGSVESSLPQRQRLESLGFEVTERQEGGYVKLLVGPFGSSELAAAQSRLEAAGIENFPR